LDKLVLDLCLTFAKRKVELRIIRKLHLSSMSRSIKVAPACIPDVKLALRSYGFPSQKALAQELGMSRGTTDKFFTGKPVDFRYFVEISEKLGLDWQAIAYIEPTPPIETSLHANPPQPPNNPSSHPTIESPHNDIDIDALVQKIRQHCHNKIQTLHGKMQLLDISQPIDLDHLYVDVNILEQITSHQWLELPDLVQGFNPTADNFDRFGLGKVRQSRVAGLEAVKKYNRLMVLGKPGSGKTTFLQHIAIECNQSRFQADRVPIFIRLKDCAKYAREQENFRLLDYISREFNCCGISDREGIEAILTQGKALILLDGLDEVTDEDEYKIIEELQQFSEDYYKNQLIITCRIAASKYRFPGFTDVEVADFSDEQIKSFAEKWFVAVAKNNVEAGLAKATQFIEKLNRRENQQIRELAITPILLHLTCLVFQSKTDFPSNRSKLYAQGLEILLKRWDETRGVERDEVYYSLTLPRKKLLLSYLAPITFERSDYFFEQNKIQQLIADYLGTLPNAKTDPDELQMDSEAVLKSIEAQHGLLVERARGIYSFSHLTFQEYFTALEATRKIISKSEPQALSHLVSYINQKHWREVFLLTTEMLPSADCLLQFMKQQIDRLVATDEKLQQFLVWVKEKSISVKVPYKLAAVMAFYLELGLGVVPDLRLDLAFTLGLEVAGIGANSPLNIDRELFYILFLTKNNLELFGFASYWADEFDTEINQLLAEFNSFSSFYELKYQIIKQRNFGYDWQFSQQQQKLIRQYYDANKLLVDCMNSGCNVSPAVRAEIEETLLLPMAEIENRGSCHDK
jgi:predicted NACHT family NTPase